MQCEIVYYQQCEAQLTHKSLKPNSFLFINTANSCDQLKQDRNLCGETLHHAKLWIASIEILLILATNFCKATVNITTLLVV